MGFRDDFAGTQLNSSWNVSLGPASDPNVLIVASSTVAMESGTSIGQSRYMSFGLGQQRSGLILDFRLKISARQANQAWFFGLFNNQNPLQATQFARFRFSGSGGVTDSFCETQSSTDTGGNEGIGSVVALPATAGTNNTYQINLTNQNCAFWAGGDQLPPSTALVTRSLHIPQLNTNLWIAIGVTNGGTAPSAQTTLTADLVAAIDTIL